MSDDRDLIPMEQGMELFNRYANSLNVVIISRIKGIIDEKVLRQSLDLVQSRHPRLNSHIVSSSKPYFKTEGTKRIPLRLIVNKDPDHWQAVVVNELNRIIDSEKVLLRATLLKESKQGNNNYLITTIHHAIVDAACGIYLHSEVMSYCQEIVSCNHIPKVSVLTAHPSLEEIIANQNSEKNQLLPRPIQRIDTLTVEKYASHQERKCGLVNRKINPDLTLKIITRCQQEKTTVHGAICSAMMLALAKQINKEEGKDFCFSCRSSVDMRRRASPPVGNENIAMLVSALTSFHAVNSKTAFWELAKQVTAQIKARLKTPEIYNVILSYREGAEYVINHPEKSYFSLLVTNIGKVRISSDYGPYRIEEISYALSLAAMGAMFAVAASTFKDKMVLNFIYSQPILSQATVNALVGSTISVLCSQAY